MHQQQIKYVNNLITSQTKLLKVAYVNLTTEEDYLFFKDLPGLSFESKTFLMPDDKDKRLEWANSFPSELVRAFMIKAVHFGYDKVVFTLK